MCSPSPKEHYNLYYIFAEEKKQHTLPPEIAAQLWKRILHDTDGEDP